MTRRYLARIGAGLVSGLLVCAVAVSLGAAPASAGDKDCSDFKSQKQAQKFFKKHNPKKDPHYLDADNDGIACEDNPCPCSHRVASSKSLPTRDRTQRMTIPMAKFYISRSLKDQYGHVWTDGSRKTWKRCKNVSAVRVSCGLAWVSGNYVYYGPVYAYFRVQDKDHVYIGTRGIKRKHL